MRSELNIKGIEELEIELSRLEDMSGVTQIVKANTADLQKKVHRNIPVLTGFLRRSFIMDIIDKGHTGRVTSNVEYGPYVEYGTFKQAAQPYMRPAIKYIRPLFLNDMKKLLKGN